MVGVFVISRVNKTDPPMSIGSMAVVAAGLWRASSLTTAGGKSDYYATELGGSALNNARRTYNGTGIAKERSIP